MSSDRRPRTIYLAKRGSEVIYVGQTLKFKKRVQEHRQVSPWCVDGVYFVPDSVIFGSDAALERERELIELHQPTNNVQFTAQVNQLPVAEGVSVTEAAGLLGWSETKVRRAARRGEIKILGRIDGKPGGAWALNRADIDYQVRLLGGAA